MSFPSPRTAVLGWIREQLRLMTPSSIQLTCERPPRVFHVFKDSTVVSSDFAQPALIDHLSWRHLGAVVEGLEEMASSKAIGLLTPDPSTPRLS